MIHHVELKVPATWIGLAYLNAIMPDCIADDVAPPDLHPGGLRRPTVSQNPCGLTCTLPNSRDL